MAVRSPGLALKAILPHQKGLAYGLHGDLVSVKKLYILSTGERDMIAFEHDGCMVKLGSAFECLLNAMYKIPSYL